jgi:hypothetical protein
VGQTEPSGRYALCGKWESRTEEKNFQERNPSLALKKITYQIPPGFSDPGNFSKKVNK